MEVIEYLYRLPRMNELILMLIPVYCLIELILINTKLTERITKPMLFVSRNILLPFIIFLCFFWLISEGANAISNYVNE